MHAKSYVIIRLPVHLKYMQLVCFKDLEEREALERETYKKITLTGWFHMNATDPEANVSFHAAIPKHFAWNRQIWCRRVRLGNYFTRMHSVNPKDVEKFHVRLLLCHMKAVKSFAELRTFDNVEHPTLKQASRARQLLQNEEWRNCFADAYGFQMN